VRPRLTPAGVSRKPSSRRGSSVKATQEKPHQEQWPAHSKHRRVPLAQATKLLSRKLESLFFCWTKRYPTRPDFLIEPGTQVLPWPEVLDQEPRSPELKHDRIGGVLRKLLRSTKTVEGNTLFTFTSCVFREVDTMNECRVAPVHTVVFD